MTLSELDKLQQTNKIPEVTVDLINDKYVKITAKQMDTARYLLVTVTEDGIKKVFQNPQETDVRIRKPDGHAVLNEPVLIEDGRLLIELTEQILAVSGCAEMELSFTDKVTSKIYSTKTIHMDIVSQVYPNDNIISSYEFDKLNQQREHLVEIENQSTENESIREENEIVREENETARIANENIRDVNENVRQEAETIRISNEENRINFINSAISNHNTSVNAHNDIHELINVLDNRLNALADSDDETLDQLSEIVTYIKSNKSLIENVTINKVNVADIINHLNSIESNKPLSANQGKILKDFIDNLQSEIDVNKNKISALEQQITNIPSITELDKYAKSTELVAAINNANATTDTKLNNYATATQLANTNTSLTGVSNRVTTLETGGNLFANNIYTDTSPFNIIDNSVDNKKVISLKHEWSTASNVISQHVAIDTNWDGFIFESPIEFDETTIFDKRPIFISGIGINSNNFVIMPTPSNTKNLGFYNYADGDAFYFNKPIATDPLDATANNTKLISSAWFRERFNATQYDANTGSLGCVNLKTISGRTNLCAVGSYVSPTGVDCIRAAANNFMITGEWNSAGNFTTRSISAPSSDIRLKTNVEPTNVDALELINQIEMVQFDWKDSVEHWEIGMIADEIEKLDPNLTLGGGYDEDGIMNVKSVNDFYLLGYCVKAIQELSAENKMLHEEINILKEKIEVL